MLRKLEAPTPVGADVASDSFQAAIQLSDTVHTSKFPLTKSGVNQFRNWLKKNGITEVHLWLESTGHYSSLLAEMAHDRGWKVTVVNPRFIKHYGISQRVLNKTDKADAKVILLFARQESARKFKEWQPQSTAQKLLRDLRIELQGLKNTVSREHNRQRSGICSEAVKASIRATIEHLKSQIKVLQKDMVRVIRSDEQLNRIYTTLLTIRGIGQITASFLVSRIDFRMFKKGRELVKFAGLDVIMYESGTSVRKKPRIARAGHSDLRAAMYWPAVVAIRDDAATAAFAREITDRKKPKMVAICAVMARLLRIAFARVRDEVLAAA